MQLSGYKVVCDCLLCSAGGNLFSQNTFISPSFLLSIHSLSSKTIQKCHETTNMIILHPNATNLQFDKCICYSHEATTLIIIFQCKSHSNHDIFILQLDFLPHIMSKA
mmetsp:Transcript_4494/g.5998  ORF Transcript_4494/g.5998 Transcript_4494/m.5998 type:complete len:108 (-) Transcript_4494:27-350(-)